MAIALLICTAVVVLWALVSARLERWRITAPIAMVAAGIAVGFGTERFLDSALNTDIAQRVAELILAVLLFVDACEVRRVQTRAERTGSARLLFIALPLAIGLALLATWLLLPSLSFAAMLAVACIVVPTDFAPAASIMRDPRIPERVRNVLNIESGYNDGVVAPLFVMALALAGNRDHAASPTQALLQAVPSALIAIALGAALGALAGWLIGVAERRGWTGEQAIRIAYLALPLLAYSATVALHGNGFVAAFTCGVVLVRFRPRGRAHDESSLVEDASMVSGLALWFFFGATVVLVITSVVDWRVVLLGLLALTAIRIVSVLAALAGSSWTARDRLLFGLLGPRGTATVVFGLLAFNAFADEDASLTLGVMTTVVLGSVLLHGPLAPAIVAWYGRGGRRSGVSAPEPVTSPASARGRG